MSVSVNARYCLICARIIYIITANSTVQILRGTNASILMFILHKYTLILYVTKYFIDSDHVPLMNRTYID